MFLVILKILISWLRYVYLGLELNSAGQWVSRSNLNNPELAKDCINNYVKKPNFEKQKTSSHVSLNSFIKRSGFNVYISYCKYI